MSKLTKIEAEFEQACEVAAGLYLARRATPSWRLWRIFKLWIAEGVVNDVAEATRARYQAEVAVQKLTHDAQRRARDLLGRRIEGM